MQTKTPKKILVAGGGNFGTALAHHLGKVGHEVTIFSRQKSVVDAINRDNTNCRYLVGMPISKRVRATDTPKEILPHVDAVVLAVPTQGLRELLTSLMPELTAHHKLISAAKGLEIGSLKFPFEIASDVLGRDAKNNIAVLSGPSFAVEIMEGQPTAVSVGSFDADMAHYTQDLFHDAYFRVYTNQDPIGLETAGALKNVIAIAAGACRGLGFKENSLAALITRGLAEITRIGVALGANPLTFKGLAGVGDLFLTCSSDKSRNFTVGYRLGKEEPLEHILSTLESVAEGVTSAKSAYALAQKLEVRAPITTSVYKVLFEAVPIKKAVHELLTSSQKGE